MTRYNSRFADAAANNRGVKHMYLPPDDYVLRTRTGFIHGVRLS